MEATFRFPMVQEILQSRAWYQPYERLEEREKAQISRSHVSSLVRVE
jgi:hypothetical protein